MNYRKILIELFLFLIVNNLNSTEHFLGVFYYREAYHVFELENDSTSTCINYPSFNIKIKENIDFKYDNNSMVMNYIKDTLRIEMLFHKMGEVYRGPMNILGFGCPVTVYKIDTTIFKDYPLFEGKYYNLETFDTISVFNIDNKILIQSSKIAGFFYPIDAEMGFTETGIKVNFQFRQDRIWQLEFYFDNRNQYYYRIDK